MKIWEKFCTFSRARQIAIIVFCLHFVAIFALSTHHLINRKKSVKTKIAVRSVRQSVPRPITSARTTVISPGGRPPQTTSPSPSGKPTQVAQQKKTGGKAAPSKKGSPKISPSDETLLQEIAENMEILNSKTSTSTRPSLLVPMSLPQSFQVEEGDLSDPSYGEMLTAFLQSALELPEYGEVKARLEIDSGGQLTHLEILETHNRKNGEFLRQRLPELVFPSPSAPLSFTITFKNQA